MLNGSSSEDTEVFNGHWKQNQPPLGVPIEVPKGGDEGMARPYTPVLDASSERSMDSEADTEETMILEDRNLTELPASLLKQVLQRPNLLKLSLKGNQLKTLPPPLSALENLYYLNLSHNAFTEVPPAVCSLPGLEILDLSFNALSYLPDQLTRLQNLMVLSLVANNMEILPPQIADLPKLVILEIDDNPIRVPSTLPEAGDDEEAWLTGLREYISNNRAELERAVLAQRHAAAAAADSDQLTSLDLSRLPPAPPTQSEDSSDSLRAAKRMGFVMHRNAPGSSYVASLHARGLSHDAHMLDNSSNGSGGGPLTSEDIERAAAGAGHHSHSVSSFSVPDTGLIDHPTPRSPLPRSPRESPWSSPRPSLTDSAEPQNSTGSRLSTLAEERERAESDDETQEAITSTTDATADTAVDARAGSASSIDAMEANSSLFKESYLADPGSGSLDPTYEKVSYALTQVANAIAPLATFLPPDVVSQFNDAASQAEHGSHVAALKACTAAMERLTAPLVFRSFTSRMDRRGMRSLVSALLAAFPELEAAWRAVQETRLPLPNLEGSMSANAAAGVDAQLHIQLEYATKQTQTVLTLLNEAIARSAQNAAQASEPATALASRIRGLSESSLSCGATARSVNDLLDKSSSARSRALSLSERRRFWDEVNLFLKSIISMLGAVKEALGVIPLLATSRIGPEVSSLARCAKEIPPLLEQSSYKVLLDGEHQSSDVPAGNNPVVLAPPTPLTAAIGAAAQALISPSTQQQTPFFEEPQFSGHTARR